MHPHWLWLTLGTKFTPGILEVANKLLLLGINGNRRLARGDRGIDCAADMRELSVAIRVGCRLRGSSGWLGNYTSDPAAGSPQCADCLGSPSPTAP
jgi:hypothetical protein